jgi:hypothetical protein
VVEAAHKGLINLTKLDNGQYEIALGPGVPGAAAQPAGLGSPPTAPAAATVRERPRERARGEGRGRGGSFSLDGAFGLIKQAIGRLGGDSRPVSAQELGEAMAEIKGDDQPVEPAQVQKLLRQAHDRELIDLAKEDDGAYTVKLRDEAPAPVTSDADEALDPPMPESSAPPSMRPTAPVNAPAGGVPSRSARFRRGSRGPRVPPPDVPKIGVVEVDPNFKPRIELLPPAAPASPVAPFPGDASPAPHRTEEADREDRGVRPSRGRGGRGGGGGGRGRADVSDRPERGERGERGGGGGGGGGGRGRRGGRGRGGRGGGGGGGGRGSGAAERTDPRGPYESSRAPAGEPLSAPPPSSPPPAPAPKPADDGESFWSRVKRGLTGGT